jgi:selenocysteine-specific elongation factor
MRVVATAGHVDHGKSSLVQAITGTDPDRFPEEKARGLTIDLGFAFVTLPSGTVVGFVDVPGHVRFVKNMLAGVGAVDVALLVVAANEGWMPQSEEHLRILDLLGIRAGMVAVTKAGLVDAETVELAQLEIAEHVEGTCLAGWPVVAVDSVSGRGMTELVGVLDAVLAAAPAAADLGRPRLWIDRVFAARGAGTVVTGTLAGGGLSIDDEVLVEPGGRGARIRGIESAHERRERIGPGARVALNLAGIDHARVHRGDAVVRPGQWAAVDAADAALELLPGQRWPRRGELHAYAGSGEHPVAFRLLDPSGRYGRLRFERPLPLAPGDRLVLRSSGRQATLGGAVVLDLEPAARTGAALERLELPLQARILAARGWCTDDDLVRLAGVDLTGARRLAGALVAERAATRVGRFLVDVRTLGKLADTVRDRVVSLHRAQPLAPGAELAALASACGVDAALVRAAVERTSDLVIDREVVRHRDHRGSPEEDPAAAAWLAALAASPFSPPSPDDHGVPAAVVRALARAGRVEEVEGVWFDAEALERARALVAGAVLERGSLTIAEIRDLLGSTRRFVVPLAGHLDAAGITRRRGDARIPGPQAARAGSASSAGPRGGGGAPTR